MKSVEDLKTGLKRILEEKPQVIAAWEGGSVATGYKDEYSDLDLSIVIKEGNPDDIFALLDDYLETNNGIMRRLRMPEPCWHGFSQCFYLPDNLPPLFYCDIVVIMADNPHKFTEPDRHGYPVIWFDKSGIYSAEETPQEEREKLVSRVYRMAADIDWLSIIELKKALVRNSWMGAQRNYLQFISRHLVPLLNIKYCPGRADFGMRYAERDYPPEVVKRLEYLIRISSIEDVREKLPEVLELFEELKTDYITRTS
jgi:predicted nucleotidyltransferase